jgi:hypothetical protein
MGFKITDKDRGYKRVRATLTGARNKILTRVGLVGPKAEAQHAGSLGKTVAEVGAIHEFGLAEPRVPQRSFIRAYYERERAELAALIRSGTVKALKGVRSPAEAVNEVGRHAAKGMKDFILSGQVEPPLALSTVLKKGHDTPLVDSHQMVEAIDYTKAR